VVSLLGLDSVSGLACFVGTTSTCQLPGTGGGSGGSASLTPFKQTGSIPFTAGTSSANFALPTTDGTLIVSNPGSVNIYVALGGSSIAATTSNVSVPPGVACIFDTTGATKFATITASGSVTGATAWQGTGGSGGCFVLSDFSQPAPVTLADSRPTSGTISAADSASSTTSGQGSTSLITGTPTASSSVAQAISTTGAASSGGLTITGTFVATLAIEASYDGGTTWIATSGLLRGTNVRLASVTAPAIVSLDLAGATNVRVRATAYTSGTPTVKFTASPASGMTKVLNAIQLADSAGTTMIDPATSGNQTTANTAVVDRHQVGRDARGNGRHVPSKADLIGGRGSTALPTAVSDGQLVAPLLDKYGRQVSPSVLRENKGTQFTSISGTSETTIVTADASNKLELYCLVVNNTSTTNVLKATIKDSTAGTTRTSFTVPASDTRGFCVPADSGLPQAAVNNNWTATLSGTSPTAEITAGFLKSGS
jgi:hypothetical protein